MIRTNPSQRFIAGGTWPYCPSCTDKIGSAGRWRLLLRASRFRNGLQASHLHNSLRLGGAGHKRNSSLAPKVYFTAALAATRPKTTQSSKELPPRRLLPCTPPAISPAAYKPGIFVPLGPTTSESAVISKPPMQ